MPTRRTDLATRASLLGRLKDWDDDAAWAEFNQVYQTLLFNFAVKLGVPERDAKDIVQDALLSVAGSIREFQYHPNRCSFKSWLLGVARNRVTDYFRRQRPQNDLRHQLPDDPARTAIIERIADPQSPGSDEVWEQEWQSTVFERAMERLKTQVSVKHFQIFYLRVIKRQPVAKVAKALGVGVGQVYLVTHRLKGPFARLVGKVERELDGAAPGPD